MATGEKKSDRHKLDVPQDAEQVIIHPSGFAATLAADHPNSNVINDDMHKINFEVEIYREVA